MQLRCLDVMMKGMLTMSVSQVRVVSCLLVLLGLIVLRRLVIMVGRFLMIDVRRDGNAPKFLTQRLSFSDCGQKADRAVVAGVSGSGLTPGAFQRASNRSSPSAE